MEAEWKEDSFDKTSESCDKSFHTANQLEKFRDMITRTKTAVGERI